jgi:predicted N-acetyltransferase YhbS
MDMRQLARAEVELLWAIDRSEVHHHVYEMRDGQLVRVPCYFDVPGWHSKTVERDTPRLYDSFDRGGLFLGMFDEDLIVGMAVMDSRRVAPNRLQLSSLFVSRAYRGRGVGTRLFEAVASAARDAGASELYVSSAPTENTVDFYLHRGCVLAPEPDPRLLALEPDDIHLVYPLRSTEM